MNGLRLPMMQQRVAPAAAALVFCSHGLDLDEQLLLRSQINTYNKQKSQQFMSEQVDGQQILTFS